jgi:ADP-ribose pyrophosphatase
VTPFRVVGTTAHVPGGYLALEDLLVEADDGERFSRFVVRHPGAVAVVPVEADRRHALLVRQWRVAVERDLLEIPAGKRDVAHEPPDETARRELEEETGLRAGRLVKLGEFYNSPGFCDEYSHVYCAFDLERTNGPHAARHEEAFMTVERIALDTIGALMADGTIVDAKTIIGLLLTRRYLEGVDGMSGG